MARCGKLFAIWEELKILADNDDEAEIDVEIVNISDSETSQESNGEQRIDEVTVKSEPIEISDGNSSSCQYTDNSPLVNDEHTTNESDNMEEKETTIKPEVHIKTEVESETSDDIIILTERSSNLDETCSSTSKTESESAGAILPDNPASSSSIRQLLFQSTSASSQTISLGDAMIVNHLDKHAVFPNILPVIIAAKSLSSSTPDSTSDMQKHSLNLPSDNWAGVNNFKVSVKIDPSMKVNGAAFCHYNQKLYTSKDIPFLIGVSASGVPSGATIIARAIFKQPAHAMEVVKRCPSHVQEDATRGDSAYEHLVQSLSKGAIYIKNIKTGSCSVTIPYEAPQYGSNESVYVFRLTCFSSCQGGINRRPILLLFTLEHDGLQLGRQSIEVKVCACPSRDLKIDQNKGMRKTGEIAIESPFQHELLSKSSLDVVQSNVGYSIKVKDEKLYNFLTEMKILYETSHSASALGLRVIEQCHSAGAASHVINLLMK